MARYIENHFIYVFLKKQKKFHAFGMIFSWKRGKGKQSENRNTTKVLSMVQTQLD